MDLETRNYLILTPSLPHPWKCLGRSKDMVKTWAGVNGVYDAPRNEYYNVSNSYSGLYNTIIDTNSITTFVPSCSGITNEQFTQ